MSQERNSPAPRFPLFISLENRPVLVVGGGKIAARRVKTLLEFGACVTVVSPELCPALAELRPRIQWLRERYDGRAEGFVLAVAATDDRQVNRRVGRRAGELGIPVSVADCKEESTFWFPAVVREGNLVAGIVSTNGDHKGVRATAQRLRESWRERD